ncbi:MAG TPA: C4-dicarboxylate ABC transporter permease [Sphaerochaeta sp.]|nr:MAG: C4-dicarboxylate ABC transporter permease [Spirochaetes bacterium GWC2_52_13]HCG64085.1 C4-dicarboxylate ABC transporter permease [Sphaerochaeta sp.]HCJ93731.1 C4-dicarboxylate ABC transporter permease [Sphaerochaeta sp.]
MEPLTIAAILFGSFLLLVFLRVPVAFALGLATLPVIFLTPGVTFFALIDRTYISFNSFLLLSVPFFLLAANLMNENGITRKLIDLAKVSVGHLPGGLGHINVLVSMLFAGISGSSNADAAGIGKVLIPAMIEQGYDRNFTIAITACSAVMGVIIPPSILMLVWGGTMSISVGSLFLAGIVPGILLGLSMMVTVYVYAIKYKYPVYERSTFKEVVIATITSIPGLVTPIIIIGGIAFGIFTPTEASAIAVLYSLAVGVFNKSMTWKKFVAVLNDTAKLTGITLFCVGTASTFSWLLAYHRVPQALVEFVNAMQLGPVGIMMIISLIFLVVGMFIDAIPAIIIMGSILYPIAIHAGIHPIHFSLVGIVSLAFGLVTPPYGMCLLIASRIGEQQVPKVLKDVGIILLPMLGILLLLVLVPEVVLFLPRLIAPQFL